MYSHTLTHTSSTHVQECHAMLCYAGPRPFRLASPRMHGMEKGRKNKLLFKKKKIKKITEGKRECETACSLDNDDGWRSTTWRGEQASIDVPHLFIDIERTRGTVSVALGAHACTHDAWCMI